jgi:hypothetical protein
MVWNLIVKTPPLRGPGGVITNPVPFVQAIF